MLAEADRRLGLVDPASPSAEPFRQFRLAIELRLDARSGNALVVTSPHPRDGKSTVAANYALVASLTRSRVLLIDGDLRNPTLHTVFGIARSPGLVELLRDDLELSHVVRAAPTLGKLDVLTAGVPIARAGDIAASPQMGALIERAGEEYDVVVIDAPPVLAASDAAGFASHSGTDCVLVVKRSAKRRHVTHALRKLELTEANVLGLVINRSGRLATYGY